VKLIKRSVWKSSKSGMRGHLASHTICTPLKFRKWFKMLDLKKTNLSQAPSSSYASPQWRMNSSFQ
jgi:hypothetical protein